LRLTGKRTISNQRFLTYNTSCGRELPYMCEIPL
jgi:hypothetical protein